MHKFKSVEKFSFKERRLNSLFEGTKALLKMGVGAAGKAVDKAKGALAGTPVGAPAAKPEVKTAAKPEAKPAAKPAAPAPDAKPAPVVVDTPAAKPAPAAPDAKTDVKPVAPEVVTRKTEDLSQLQGELSGKLEAAEEAPPLKSYLDEVGKVSGIEFQRVVNVSTPSFDALKSNPTNGLYEAILKEFTAKNANFSGFAKFLGIKEEKPGTLEQDMKMIVSMALANSFVKKAKADFGVKYAHLTAFLATDAGKAFAEENIEAKFTYNTTGGVSVELAGGRDFEAAYAEFAKAQPDAAVKPEDKAKEGALPTRDAKLQCMENSKIGKMLKMFGVNFEDVLDNKSPFAALAFVMLGFGGKLGLGDSDMFDGLPETGFTAGLEKTFNQLRVAAQKSGYGIDKDPIDYTKLNLNPPNYDAFDVAKFSDTVKGAKALDPAKDGIKLATEFKLGEGENPANVSVDLTDGGEIVVEGGTADAGVKLTINDKEVTVAKGAVAHFGKGTADGDIKAKSGIAVLTGVIPAGTVFTKKCKLSEAKVEVAATE
ncbi:MAG: hypothetical protein Q8P62_00215 [Candidatus Peregrinibacteria bacterium]|nr:hypothetical protein [Candidatus Peregrinibacteria bacterium]